MFENISKEEREKNKKHIINVFMNLMSDERYECAFDFSEKTYPTFNFYFSEDNTLY